MKAWKKKSMAYLGTFTMVLQFLQGVVLAGPVGRSSRMVREVYPEIEPEKLEGNQAEVCIVGDVVYGAEEPVPADQPCLKCKCQPPGVQCETTQCVKKPGCRAIHKPNKCCPEYQCECEHEGRIYANGERLEIPPGGECRVCYCRGGEVQCAEVSCYIRTDCEGRTVPGQCCPKYDHCPPREPLIDRVTPYTTQPSLTSDPEPLWPSPSPSVTNDKITTTIVYDVHEITNENSNKITEAQTQPTPGPKPTQPQPPKIETLEESNKIHDVKLIDQATQTDSLDEEMLKEKSVDNKDAPKITIQEIIPEIKEFPITGPPKREIGPHPHRQALDEQAKQNQIDESDKQGNGSDLVLGDTESDSSEISEIYHHPPPVLKIGDQLLFLKKGELVPGKDLSTPLPVITIIGAEGLQRGTEDSGEFHEIQLQDPHKEGVVSENPHEKDTTSEKPDTTHIISLVKPKARTEDSTGSSISTIEDFLLNLTKTQGTDDGLDANVTMMTENVVNKIKTLSNIESTTDLAHLVQKVYITDVNATLGEPENSSINPDEPSTSPSSSTVDQTWYEVNTTSSEEHSTLSNPVTLLERVESAIPTSTEEIETNATRLPIESRYEDLGEAKSKHDEEAVEQNPEYPPIPDIMSPQNADELSEHLDAELAQVSSEDPLLVQRNISLLDTSLNETTQENLNETTLKSPPEAPTTTKNPHPLINENAALPTSLLRAIAPTDTQTESEERTETTLLTKSSEETSPTHPAPTTTKPPPKNDRSKETMEEATSGESGESTTPRNRHASVMLSVEDASVETTLGGSQELDTTDLVETIPGIQESTEESENKGGEKNETRRNPNKNDVEMIDPLLLSSLKSNKTHIDRNTKKSKDEVESDAIFKHLNEELKTVSSHVIDNQTDEDTEAEAIFRELLEEATSSTMSPSTNGKEDEFPQGREKESALLQRVSEAITKFQVKESKESLDSSILGILRDFFSSQYKYYVNGNSRKGRKKRPFK